MKALLAILMLIFCVYQEKIITEIYCPLNSYRAQSANSIYWEIISIVGYVKQPNFQLIIILFLRKGTNFVFCTWSSFLYFYFLLLPLQCILQQVVVGYNIFKKNFFCFYFSTSIFFTCPFSTFYYVSFLNAYVSKLMVT